MTDSNTQPVYGILAQFDSPEALIAAATKVRDAGYRHTDAYTSFPVHGIYEALGARKSRLPLAVLLAGIAGAAGGMALQSWVSETVYPHIVSGKPLYSWPSFVPIVFECTILAAALTACIGMLARNGLPRPHHPVFEGSRFEEASTAGFFLCVEASDPQFDAERTLALLNESQPSHVETLFQDEDE